MEIEQATLAYIGQQSDAGGLGEPAYEEGLREAIAAAINLGFKAIEHGEQDPEIPQALLDQARLAVQNGVQLETVVQRYVAGYTLLGNFVMEETEEGDLLASTELRRIREAQAVLFNRVVAAVSAEYRREHAARSGTGERSRIDQVERLLAGEVLDTSGLEYDFDRVHTGLIALGRDAQPAIGRLARSLDRRLLVVRITDQTHWAWLGGTAAEKPATLKRAISQHWPPHLPLALGEQDRGIDGWRLTHRQADAVLQVALHADAKQVHYADEALLASISGDDLLKTSLQKIYLDPLSRDRDGGKALCETLRAYFDAGQTVSSAAAVLNVSPKTVGNRLRAVEKKLGRPLNTCGTELDAALRLKKLDRYG
ncbi:MAG TPA: helix-turn-helix domain-containing protein [Solirubrobacterales bacterium]|nr:helix-turn-helix domain-containing protein [Solirubrobacterales bacterium]